MINTLKNTFAVSILNCLFSENTSFTIKDEFLKFLFNCFLLFMLWVIAKTMQRICKFIEHMIHTILDDNIDTSDDTEFLVKND